MKIWVTKYALTQGVFEDDAEPSTVSNGLVVLRQRGNLCLHGDGREWHRTRESALRRADAMRKAKIAALKKQIAKLESIDFAKTTFSASDSEAADDLK